MLRRYLRHFAWILPLIILLSACGSGKTAQPQGGSSPTAAPAPAPAAPKGPVKLVIGGKEDMISWDIHNHNYTYTEAIHQHVFDYLVYFNLETGKFDPGLATSWGLVNDTTWEFKLRKDVKFQNGDPFTGDDVKYTLERVSRDKSLKENGSNRTIKEVQVVDPYTVRIITTQKDPILLNRLSRIGSGMLPSKYLAEKGWDNFQKNPIGTGAYKLKEWVKDDHLTLVAWPESWRGKPPFDEIVFRDIPEPATRVNELVTGGVDIALGLGPDDMKALQGNKDINVVTQTTQRVYVAYLRTSGNYATANPKVREAMDYAIDDKALGDAIFPGLATPTRTRLVPGISGSVPKYFNTYLYDVNKAKQLLAEAGYSDSKPCTIGLLSRNGTPWADIAQTLAGMLEKAGFKVKLDILEQTAYNNKINANQNPDMYITSFGNSMKDADLAINFARTEQNKDWMGYSNPQVDKLINDAAMEMDQAKRVDMYSQLMDILANDRPQLQFFMNSNAYGVRKNVTWKPRSDEMLWLYGASKTGN